MQRLAAAAFAMATAACVHASLDAPQVNATFYAESFCPDCLHFATTAWIDVWNTPGVGYGTKVGDGQGIINFEMVPYGNARISADNKTITCQHGAKECVGNTLENCIIAKSGGAPAVWLPVIQCLDDGILATGSLQPAAAQKCVEDASMAWGPVNTCWTGPEGHTLDIAAAYRTSALVPPHQFVPWVTLSDEPGAGTFCDENGCDGFLKAACDAYTGTKPAACSAAAVAKPQLKNVRRASPRCPAEW